MISKLIDFNISINKISKMSYFFFIQIGYQGNKIIELINY